MALRLENNHIKLRLTVYYFSRMLFKFRVCIRLYLCAIRVMLMLFYTAVVFRFRFIVCLWTGYCFSVRSVSVNNLPLLLRVSAAVVVAAVSVVVLAKVISDRVVT